MIKIQTKSQWVWTKLAISICPYQKEEGTPIWDIFRTEAPERWVNDGLIREEGKPELPEEPEPEPVKVIVSEFSGGQAEFKF